MRREDGGDAEATRGWGGDPLAPPRGTAPSALKGQAASLEETSREWRACQELSEAVVERDVLEERVEALSAGPGALLQRGQRLEQGCGRKKEEGGGSRTTK